MKNLVCVKISGLNLIRIIDRLVEKNVFVTNLIVKTKYIKFEIDEKNLHFLDKICKKEHKFYQIIYKSGFKQLLYRLPYLLGALVATLIIFSYFFANSLFLKSVNLTYKSNLNYDLSAVSQLLEKNGITSGMRKNKVSISEIQKLILLEIESVEGCEVRLNGNNLNICIYPANLKYEISSENIYSKFDGVIVSAEAYSGKLKVKAGDTISKGDLLIENNNGASGKILAKTYFLATKIYNENQQKLIYTGNNYKVKDFLICSKFWIFGKNYCSFDKFIVEKCSFWVNKNLFVPILCQETIYKEIEIKEETIPFESVKDEIKNELYLQAKQQIIGDSEISNVTYSIVTEGSYTRVDCFVEVIMDIAK